MPKVAFTPGTDAAPESAATVADPSQVEASEVGTQTPSPVIPSLTPDTIRSLLREELDARDRAIQSARDKQEARINQRFTSLEKVLTASGVQLTDAQRTTLHQQAANEILTEQTQANPSPVEDKPTAPEAQPQSKEIAAAWQVMDDEGMDIEPDDPEASLIDWTSPAKARRTTLAAIDAKRARQAKGRNPIVGGQPGASKAGYVRELNELIANPSPRNIKRMKELEELIKK